MRTDQEGDARRRRLGLRFLPRHVGRGYATEAAAASLEHGWRDLGLRRIVAIVLPANTRSIRVLEKVGLRFERMIRMPDDEEELALYAVAHPEELVEVITGLRRPPSGSVRLDGQEVTGASPRRITELGAAHVPEDRQRDGLVLPYSVADNLALQTYYKPPFARGVVLQEGEILRSAEARIKEFDIRTPSAATAAGSLSGGNQQKVIVAREFSRAIRLLVASQPTRGLDVGSIEYIHGRILEKRGEGTAVRR